MATNKLTDRAVQAAKAQSREYEMTDGGGLALRIKTDGTKLWAFRFTNPATKAREREYLGSYPDLKLADARTKVEARRTLIAKRINPSTSAALLESVDEAPPGTVEELFAIWYAKHVLTQRTSATDHASITSRFDLYTRPKIGGVPLALIRRGQIMQVIDVARDAGKMRTANLVLSELRQMFCYAVAREWMQGDPTAAITRKDAGGTDNESDRVLSDAELVMARDRMAKPPEQKSRYYKAIRRVLPLHIELACWWTLATAGRAIEVATLRKSLVDTKARTWTIPAEVAKNKEAHVVQLSDFALVVWRALTDLSSVDFVFEGGKDDTHLSEKEVTRRLTDRQTREKPLKNRKNSTDLDLPGGHWTQHDLRRTAATIMGEAGFAKEVIDRCLNHRDPDKTSRTYQRQKMMPQRKAAFEALGEHLSAVLGDPESWLPGLADADPDSNVVPIRKRA